MSSELVSILIPVSKEQEFVEPLLRRVVDAPVQLVLIGYLILGCLESSLCYGRGSFIFWWLVAMITTL